ncbi:MAG: hypothetical protein M0C28_35610 [Candidatus Moduliflexus flocculans]|nr:hypothetical protein [Candidatus Moduliflexus flocculans]
MGMEGFMVAMVESPAVVDVLLRRLVDYYFRVSLAHLRGGGRRPRRLLHRERFRHPERARRRRRPLPPLLPAPPGPSGRPGPRLRPQGHDALLRRVRPAHPGHDRGRRRRPPGAPARRPGHGPGPAQSRVRRPRRVQRLRRYAPLAHRGTPDLVRARTRELLEVMKPGGGYIASPSHDYLSAGDEGRERLRPLRDGKGIQGILTD